MYEANLFRVMLFGAFAMSMTASTVQLHATQNFALTSSHIPMERLARAVKWHMLQVASNERAESFSFQSGNP
ncbi:hypothetical protein CR492_00040 [Methylocella silvestris]|uniref:Uncharacterized protein n=2 Tax=Methylocella silvestris TaxID=199596 RepID=A0A2J7TKT7_METSI|nr:hypothetical protein CR492_00040 [Methylocella silvestris]